MSEHTRIVKMTAAQREALLADIDRLRQEEPGISGLEICRRLAPQYPISGMRIRHYL